MHLTYQAYNKVGQAVSGVIDAADEVEATELLRREGLYVATIGAARAGAGATLRPPAKAKVRPGRRLKNLSLFWRQLHVLVATGTPLAQALAALERQARDPTWKAVVADVHRRVVQGSSLSAAMEANPGYFETIPCSLIAAGEMSGSLDKILDRLGMMTRKHYHVRSALLGAMVYPALLMVVAIVVLAVMFAVVLPRFTELFVSLDVPLPPTTLLVMRIGALLREYGWVLPAAVVLAVILAKRFLRTEAGRRAWDTAVIRAPVVGGVARSFITAHVVRMLGVLLEGRVPLIQALRLCRQGSGNWHYGDLFDRAENAVNRGDPVSIAFAETELIPPAVYESMRSGEQSGQMGPMLLNVAEIMDDENEVLLRSITSVIEPLILIAVGILVGFVAISLFMPLFDLTALTSGGGE